MARVKVLVAYGSTRGGTAGLAHMVADAFAIRGISTEVRRAGDIRDLDGADAVVVGGALYSNRWHPDAVAFVGRHRAALQQLPVWFFSSGPLDDSARSGALAAVPQVSGLAREIDIRGHMTFGGLLDQRPAGLLGLFSYRGAEGDFRDSQHVTEWVERIAADLLRDGAPTVRVIEADQPSPPPPAPPAPEPPLPEPPEPLDPPRPPAKPPPVEPPPVEPPPPVTVQRDQPAEPHERHAKRAGLRRYLRLDEDGDDDGLDLFGEEELEGVGDPGER